jgi:uncharacterized peroxidase-related enzyme
VRHHGEVFLALTKDKGLLSELERDPLAAALDSRQRAIVEMAVHLTRSPAAAENDIANMRQAGLSDEAIHDAIAITAYFNFVNRIALGLGVGVRFKVGHKEPDRGKMSKVSKI